MTKAIPKLTATDGKRSVTFSPSTWGDTYVELSICRNGWQTTTVEIDRDMVVWLRDMAEEFHHFMQSGEYE